MIEQLKKQYSDFEDLDFVSVDVTVPFDSNSIEDGSFACVIDKATLDSVLCSSEAMKKSKQMLDNIYRILEPEGIYICISYGAPDTREMLFGRYDWKI